jgi:DNA gyrase subunit A
LKESDKLDNFLSEENQNIIRQDIVKEMKSSFLDYAMSVIVARALPDVRDGLKPVQRRIIYAMHKFASNSGMSFTKCAQVVGDTIGKYHPHGDAPAYEALVNMAQDWDMRYPLIVGQGNFGSIDGDPPAAQRYTECRLHKLSQEMLTDINKNTVDFRPNYSGLFEEPTVLPAKAPMVLLNGSLGIAVGMATNIPPHNLGEVFGALKHLLNNPESSVEDLCEFIKAPDFPTAGIVFNKKQILEAYKTGSGAIPVRGKVVIEEHKNKQNLIITEVPYKQNKASLMIKIADLIKEKQIEGVTDLRDESTSEIRVVLELSRNANAQVIENKLYKLTPLQQNFNLNFIALEGGTRPRRFNLKDALKAFITHRSEVLTNKFEYELKQNKDRLHILEGFLRAVDILDELIDTIRKSYDRSEARENIIKKFEFSEVQTDAILDMRLHKLAGLEIQKISEEHSKVVEEIARLEKILSSKEELNKEIEKEFDYMVDTFGDKRKTKVVEKAPDEFEAEDLIEEEDVVVILTKSGYIKRFDPESFRSQNRGGKGVIGTATKEGDEVLELIFASTHDELLFFSSKGKVYKLKTYELPEGSKNSKGTPIVNFLPVDKDESISTFKRSDSKKEFFLFVTNMGVVKRTSVSDFKNIRQSGIIAINFKTDDDYLLKVMEIDKSEDTLIADKAGKVIRIECEDISLQGRTASGVRGLNTRKGVQDIAIVERKDSRELIILSCKGIGKKTRISEFSSQNRGGMGVKIMNLNSKTGELAAMLVDNKGGLLITSRKGQIIKISSGTLPILSRLAMGVRLFRLETKDEVSSAILIEEGTEEADRLEL